MCVRSHYKFLFLETLVGTFEHVSVLLVCVRETEGERKKRERKGETGDGRERERESAHPVD